MPEKRNELPARHELKYFINRAELAALRARLQPVLRLDPYCRGGRPYVIRSLYLDDIDNSAYVDKIGGVMERDKYRIRVYGHNDQQIFLERKRKIGDLIQKSSAQITRKLCEQIVSGDPRGLQSASSPLLQDVYVQMRTKLLRPAVIVDYEREAYLHPAENVRITFDMTLRTGLHSRDLFNPNLPTVNPLDPGLEILEIKFDRVLPDYIRALIDGIQADRSAVSKYVLCRRYEPLDR